MDLKTEIENIILFIIMIDNKALELYDIDEDIFDNSINKELFKICKRLGKQAFFASVYAESNAICAERLNRITAGNYSEYQELGHLSIPILLKSLKEVKKVEAINEISKNAKDLNIQEAIKKLKKLDDLEIETEEKKNIYSEIYEEYEVLAELGTLPGLSTGYNDLDNKIYGFLDGNIYIIAARPSMGKSCFALNIIKNIAKTGKNVLLFALEETKKNIIKRLTANYTGIHLHRLMLGKIKENEWELILSAQNEIEKLGIVIDDRAGLTSQQIVKRIHAENKKKKVDIVVIDHIQELADKAQNRHLAISEGIANIKACTKELDCPVILLSQLNRGVESRVEKRPTLADLKESGDIEAKADCVMFLYRQGYYDMNENEQEIEVIIAKARNGRLGKSTLKFDGSRMTIKEPLTF